jgi:hypothetical protein
LFPFDCRKMVEKPLKRIARSQVVEEGGYGHSGTSED